MRGSSLNKVFSSGASDSSGKMDVFKHDRLSVRMYGTKIGILEHFYHVGLYDFSISKQGFVSYSESNTVCLNDVFD